MNKANYSIASAILLSAFIFSATSCSKDKPNDKKPVTTSSSSVSTAASTTVSTTAKSTKLTSATMQTDINGNKITEITITDKNGSIVTDKSGSAVTEVAIAGTDNSIITNPDGSYAKPAVSGTTAAYTTVPAETTTAQVTEQPVTENSGYTPEQGNINFAWICSNKDNTLPGDGQLAVVTFKIKDNAPTGDYQVNLSSISGDSIDAFARYDGTKKNASIEGGIISVGTGYTQPENGSDTKYLYANLTNTCGNPGDVVTVYIDILNNYPGAIGCLTLNLSYDSNALEMQSITQGTLFDTIEKGTFASSLSPETISE